MMCCKSCARTAVVLTVLAPLLSLAVLGVTHNKVSQRQPERKQVQQVASHVKKQGTGVTDSHGSLLFDPPLLDFGDCAISVVWRRKVNVKNNRDKPVNILSISGSSLHFHCSFVVDKVLEPQANTTFEVAFLSREEGYAEDTLYVHTNRGSFPYRIQARGTANPFLARPLVNVRIPVNTTFSPLIHLYNPFSSALQVLELFGSSCDLHLEMPPGLDGEPSADWWTIPPHQTRALAKVNYLSLRPVNLTAFVRIRTNYTNPHGSLMLPVNFEVTSQPLLFCPQQYLDFGVLKPGDAKTLKLFVINSGSRPVTVQSVTAGPPNDGLTIDFSPVKVPPSLTTPTLIALVTFRATRTTRTSSGRISLSSKNGHLKATVAYQVTVPSSYLHFNRSSANFLSNSNLQLPDCRSFTVQNDFALPVHIAEVSIDRQGYVEITEVSYVTLKPREVGTIARMCLKQLPDLKDGPFVVEMTVKTNASAPLTVPVSVFNGRLLPYWSEGPNSTHRFIGNLAKGSFKEVYLALCNRNPIGVALEKWSTNSSATQITYLGSEATTPDVFKSRTHFNNLTLSTAIRPDSCAVFHIRVRPEASHRLASVIVDVKTEHEHLSLSLQYRTVSGTLQPIPDPLSWKANFLDPYLTTEVRLNSTLKEAVTVVGFQAPGLHKNKLSFSFYDDGDGGVDESSASPSRTVEAMQSAGVGRLAYPVDWHCAALPLRRLVAEWQQDWLSDLDSTKALFNCYESITQSLWNDSSIRLVTKEVGFTEMPLRLDLNWPTLSVKRKVHFPLTEIGRSTKVNMKLANPTSNVILAQVLWMEDAGIEAKDLNKLPNQLTDGVDANLVRSGAASQAFNFDESDESDGRDSLMVYLTPGSQADVAVTFTPPAEARYRSILIIKNNVTGMELVSLSGQGQSSKFLLANRPPGSSEALLFDISDEHLKNCDTKSRYLIPSVTVKRTFTARNRGPFPISISGFEINDSPCEGYGFRVLQCRPLTLMPNDSHSIEVAFTPDFTQTKVTRTLRVLSGDTFMNYTLVATLPNHMISTCSAALPRPYWEAFLYYGALALSVFLMLCVITGAFVDADRILKSSVVTMVTVVSPDEVPSSAAANYPATGGHLLDLRAVAKETTSSTPQPAPAPPATSEGTSKKSKKNKHKSKANKLPPIQVRQSPPSPPPVKRQTPSPTPSSSTPPRSCSPISVQPPTPPVVKVVTTKEETRIFAKATKSGAKKSASKPAKATSDESKPTRQTVSPAEVPQKDRKRARSSSVPSVDRSKPPAVKKEEPPIPTVAPVASVQASDATPAKKAAEDVPVNVWQRNSLKATTVPLQPSTKPQPPVGKILPEVRKAPEEPVALPKPIGYRDVQAKQPAWIAEPKGETGWTSSSTAWWPESQSLFSRPAEPLQDWFGLRSLASDLNGVGSASAGWPEPSPQPPAQAPVSRVYSPWSVPHWLDVTQQRRQNGEQQRWNGDSLYTQPADQGGQWESGNQTGTWPSYSPF